jgi:hypothetical protein
METKTNEWRDCALALMFLLVSGWLLLFVCPML